MTQATEPTAESNGAAPANGLYYRGRPDWLTDDVLAGLHREAADRRTQARLLRRQHHAEAGPLGLRLAGSPEMLSLITRYAAPVAPAGAANYLYYEKPGDGIDPHVDTHQFDLNVLMLLDHSWTDSARSCLMLFPDGPRQPLRFRLDPGEFVLFRATGVVHARSNVTTGETVCNLGIGYQPLAALPTADYWRP